MFAVLTLSLSCCLWVSCSEGGRADDALFGQIDSLLEANPDSGYSLLLSMRGRIDSLDREKVTMRYAMSLASAQNKLFLNMPSDSDFQKVVSYYDQNGSSNERMKAHYLMGCIYRDQKEAPQAIRCFQEATACADTTRSDCDYATLLRVYSQMGEIYYYQYFPQKAIECYRMQSLCAAKAGDIYNQIVGVESLVEPYSLLRDTVRVFAITDSVFRLYTKNQMPENAARVFPMVIYMSLGRGDYTNARKLMDAFECGSGLFDKDGKITDRHYGRYDYARGLCCLSEGRVDSAKIYFQRLLESGFEYEAYDGLARIYRETSNPDSAYKYMEMSDKKLDAQLHDMQIQAVTMSDAMYDYSRFQHESEIARMRSEKATLWLWIIVISAMAVLSFFIFMHRRKLREVKHVREAYRDILSQYHRLRSDRENLLSSFADLDSDCVAKEKSLEGLRAMIQDKDAEIEKLRKRIDELRGNYSKYLVHDNVSEFKECSSARHLLNQMSPYPQSIDENDALWGRLLDDFAQYMPNLHLEFVHHSLSKQRRIIVAMVTMGLSSSVISHFLGTSIQNVSKQESTINEILFGEATSKTLKKNLLSLCLEKSV